MNTTERNREKRIRKRNREIEKYVEELAIGKGETLLKSLTDDQREDLASKPHPKLPNAEDLSALSYVEWLCGKGYHRKATAFLEEVAA